MEAGFTKIKDFVPGDIVKGAYILKSVELRKASNGKQFLSMILMDETGEVSAKQWDADPGSYDMLKKDAVHIAEGKADLFRDEVQFNVKRISIASDEYQKNIDKLVPSAPVSPEKMLKEISGYIMKIRNEHIRDLVKTLVIANKKKLIYYPAAKSFHHSIRSGLLYHILRMLRTADALKNVYEKIDTDLLYAGIILHDIEKVTELDASNIGTSEYSLKGQLLGHIHLGVSLIDRAGHELGTPDEIIMILQHIIASHHGEPEFGSYKKPMILEAQLLNYIDLIDSRVYDFEEALKNTLPGQLSEPVRSLDRIRIYNPDI